jgi:2,3-bisphosphoglycerate-independent phosphoglycerate mutase
MDGLADEPNPALEGKTPLEAAKTPTLCRLAGSGGQGLIATGSDPNVAPETDEGLIALLGVGKDMPKMGRGMLEALGQGLPISPGTIVFRGNLATLAADGTLIDRRAGRIRSGVEDLLTDLTNVPLAHGLTGHIYPAHEHRVVVMLRGPELSGAVGDTDPGSESTLRSILAPRPLDKEPSSARAAEALSQLLDHAHRVLSAHPHNAARKARGEFSANCIITRGAHKVMELPGGGSSERTALVSACTTALGVARALGLEPASSTLMTGNLDTDLDEKFRIAGELLSDRSFVAVHVKGTDIAAHDRKPLEKRDFIQEIDGALGRFLRDNPAISSGLRLVVSADHGTSSITGNHLSDPVPVLLGTWDPEEEESAPFDETSASEGALGLLAPGELAEILWTG